MKEVLFHVAIIAMLCSLLATLSRASAETIDGHLRIFSKDELKQSENLLLSICGHVYDVSSGDRFYGIGGSYEAFSRTDATRAMALSDSSELYLNDNISAFNGEQCIAAEGWLNYFRYHETYRYVGVVSGYFFSESGIETNGMRRFRQCLVSGHQIKGVNESKIQRVYDDIEPPECDRAVTDDKIHIISCNAGYTPRKSYFTAGHSVDVDGTSRNINIISCECLRLDRVNDRPDLQLYHDDCHLHGTECIFDNHELDIHH